MKFFLTGATGFIGGQIARQLRSDGHEVRALARPTANADALRAAGIRVFPGDVGDRRSLRAPMEGVDGVFHVAGWYRVGSKDRATAIAVNVEGTRNVLETMRDLGIPKGVYTSTLAVNSDTRGAVVDEGYRRGGPWLTLYDESKWRAHFEVAEPLVRSGLPLVTVLPGVVYGPGDTSPMHDVWVEFLTRRLRAVPRVTAYCFGHVDDVARAHLLAMERGAPRESYIIAGPPHTLVDALEVAGRATGIPVPSSHPPAGLVRFLAALTRSERLRVATATYLGSNARAVRELGYRPRSLAEGLPPTLAAELALLRPPERGPTSG